jgi:hypothetical protein
MKTKTLATQASLLALSLVAFSTLAAPARANETAEQIRLLKAKLRALEQRLDAREKEQRAVARRRAPGQVAGVPAFTKGEAGYPDRFYFKGITITPGGYFAADSVWRSRWLGNDIAISYNSIPFGNVPSANTSEFRFSARTSRPSLRVDADVNPTTHLTGYVEIDFLGAAQTANSNQTNSYNPRVRHLYSTLDLNDYGLHFLAGQTWNLAVTNAAGIRPETVLAPSVVNSQNTVGFIYPRQPQLRVTKDLGDFTVAFSAEAAATTWQALGTPTYGTSGVISPGGAAGVPVTTATPASGGLFNSANSYSFNSIPDLITKAAYDTTLVDRHVHVEGFGLLRQFIDREYWGNHSVWGGGGGGSVAVEAIPKLLDLQAEGLVGSGVGRYGAGNLPDATTSLTGAPLPAHERIVLVGATLHATPATDFYAYAGGEFQGSQSQFGVFGKTLFVSGLGNYLYNNLGCEIEPPSAYGATNPASLNTTCTGETKDVREITGGVWHTFYKGDFGKLRVGVQYQYAQRDGFAGIGGSPKGVENSVYTSIRYYPF